MFAARVCTTNGTAALSDSWGWSKYLRLIISSRLINARRYRGAITAASRGTRHFARRSLESRSIIGIRNWNRTIAIDPGTLRASATQFDLRSISRRRSAWVNQVDAFSKLSSSNLPCYSRRIRVCLLWHWVPVNDHEVINRYTTA